MKLPHIPAKEESPVRVLMVCLGNICRSPAAEGILRSIVSSHNDDNDWVIDSAGTYGGHSGDLPDRRMRIHAEATISPTAHAGSHQATSATST